MPTNEYMREYMLNRYHSRRAKAIKFLGGKCEVCGTTADLEIDHINPEEKSFGVSKMWSVSKDRFWAEVEKCQLLCVHHHSEKSLTDGSQDDKIRRTVCKCTKVFMTVKAYAGHKRWCRI